MASVAEEFAFQARCITDQIQEGPNWPSAWWTPEETSVLLSAAASDKWLSKASSALKKDVEVCIRHFESILMESAHSLEKPAPSKKWTNPKLIPRLTERQQLALLLKGEFSHESLPEQLDHEYEQWRPAEYEQWSVSKQALWNSLDSTPDKFYYEYLAPGEVAKTGSWSEGEEQVFLHKLRLHPPAGLWGLFSLHIQGRTGQECDELFKALEAEGKLDATWKSRAAISEAPQTPSALLRRPLRSPPDSLKLKRKRLSAQFLSADLLPTLLETEYVNPRSLSALPRSLTKTPEPQPPPRVAKVLELSPLPARRTKSEPQESPRATRIAEHTAPPPRPVKTPDLHLLQVASNSRKAPIKALDMDSNLEVLNVAEPLRVAEPVPMETLEFAQSEDEEEEEPGDDMPFIAFKTGATPRPSIPPFSSSCLLPVAAPTDLTSEFEDETFSLKHAHQIQAQRLREVFRRQLDLIRRPEEFSSNTFSFQDGCHALAKATPYRDDFLFSSVFEMPWTREQRSRRCVESCQEAQKEADRMYQIQQQAVASLRQNGLA